jgi:hypothetical protein
VHVILWEYLVRPGAEADFERLYGSDGEWVALFRQSPDFVGTTLFRQSGGGAIGAYLTIDRWSSAAAYDAFRSKIEGEYQRLDRAGAAFTTREALLGRFDLDTQGLR